MKSLKKIVNKGKRTQIQSMFKVSDSSITTLQWRHNGLDGVSNHQRHDCLLNRLFGRRSTKTSKLPVTGLCAENSPGTGEFPSQMASNAEMFPFDDGITSNKTLICEKFNDFFTYIGPSLAKKFPNKIYLQWNISKKN